MEDTWRARFAHGIKKTVRCVRISKQNSVVCNGETATVDNDSSFVDAAAEEIGGQTDETAGDGGGHPDRLAGPPLDDCCPICFGVFTVACRANCSHWFCGSCIMQYWNYSAASKPCKCPMCASNITKLTPEKSLYSQQEAEVTKVLENVNRYNRLFVGGALGLVQKVRESPLFIKRIFNDMMDPNRPDSYLHEMRLFAMILSVLYAATPFNFIPTGGLGIVRLFDYSAITVILVLRFVGLYRKRRLAQRVRNLAAAQPLDE